MAYIVIILKFQSWRIVSHLLRWVPSIGWRKQEWCMCVLSNFDQQVSYNLQSEIPKLYIFKFGSNLIVLCHKLKLTKIS